MFNDLILLTSVSACFHHVNF